MNEDILFHTRTAFLVMAILGVLQAVGSWIALRSSMKRPLAATQRLWMGASLIAAAMGLVIGLRSQPAAWANLLSSHAFMLAWFGVSWGVLRMERGCSPRWILVAALAALSLMLYAACLWLRGEAGATAYPALVALVGCLAVAAQARAIARQEASDGARLTAIAFSLTAVVLLVRGVDLLSSTAPHTSVSGGLTQVFMAVGGIAVFVLGNLGYLGLQIERLTRQRLQAEISGARADERSLLAQERAQALQGLVEERDLLIQRLRRLDAVQQQALMAAALPHELRQPLGAIRLNLDALVHHMTGKGVLHRRLLVELDQDTQRLAEMVDSFMSQISSAFNEDLPEPIDSVDVVAAVRAAMAVIQPRARLNGVQLQFEAPGVILVPTSAAMLHQVLLILLTNALDAVSGQPLPRAVSIDVVEAPATVQVHVRDNGPGIPARVRPHVFQPFASSKADGSGIGLALARRLARRSHAELCVVTPDAQAGAVFRIDLPRDMPPASVTA